MGKEAAPVVEKLELDGVISRMEVPEKGFFSPVMSLRKIGPQGIKKVIDFCLLKGYIRCTKANFPGMLTSIRKVRANWKVFTCIDLAHQYLHIPVCGIL